MNKQTRTALRLAMHRIENFNDECEQNGNTNIDAGDAWILLKEAHDAIEAVFTPTHGPSTEELQEHLLLGIRYISTFARMDDSGALKDWAADAETLLPRKRKFNVYITLHGGYEAHTPGEAADASFDEIAMREGMDIMKHEVVEQWESKS